MPLAPRFARRLMAAAFAASLSLAAADASAQYNAEISRWQTQDALDPVSASPVLFVGSSSIRRWEQLTRDFADYNVLQRGLGGSLISDMVARENDLVLAYKPRAVVLWAGTNDLAGGTSGMTVADNFKAWAGTIRNKLPDTDIFYLGIMPTPGRQSNRPQEDIANAQISAYCAANSSKMHYIDLPAAFAPFNPYNDPAFTSKFVDDIHLNRDGYNYWTSVIKPQIQAIVPPNRTFVPNADTLKPGEKLLFDFGPSDSTNGDATGTVGGNTWNNWFGVNGGATILPGEHKANLVSSANRPTGIRMTITAQFAVNGKQNGGLTNPSPAQLGDFAVPSVTSDYFYSTGDGKQGGGDDDTAGGFMLDGLDPSLTYNFKLFAARDTTDTRITRYDISGANTVSAVLLTSGAGIGVNGANTNNSQFALLNGVRPDAFGQVYIDLTALQGGFAYISGMEITAVPEPTAAVGTAAMLMTLARRRR